MKTTHFFPTESNGLQLKWCDGWIEVFSEDKFEEEHLNSPRRTHLYHKRKNGKYQSCIEEYYLTVRGNIALLNFGGAFEKANSSPSRRPYIGELKILFNDNTRRSVKKALWKLKGEKVFEENDIAFSWESKSIPQKVRPFQIPAKRNKIRHESLAVLRSGQLLFRKNLLKVYNQRCCITGFNVKEALEAAHIVPFSGKSSDHIQNGLLVRADLHRLFDKYLISIDPNTFQVKLAPASEKNSMYSSLHKKRLSLPTNKNHRPSTKAL